MPKLGSCCALAVLLAGATACREDGGASVAPRTEYAAVVRTLEPFIRQEMADKDLPGLSIALVDGDDIVWAQGFGFANPADSTPATARTLYRVGSIAKLVTAIGVMQLVENGQVDLDAPIERYLPDFHPANSFGKPITLRELLSHRSGLVREPPVGSYFDSSRVAVSDAVESLNQTAVVLAPGSRVKYSDAGIAVAGRVIEQLRGQPFAVAAQGAVLDLMELGHSTFSPDLSLDRSLAQGFLWTYDGRAMPAPKVVLGVPPASGLYSTATDLAGFMSVLLQGGQGRGRLLKPETVAQMWSVAATDSAGTGAPAFGLGFRVSTVDGTRTVGHSAAFGGHSTELVMMPDEKIGAVVITNEDAANAVTSRIANAALILTRATKHKQALPALTVTQAVKPEVAKRLDGTW
ncbi:MAG: beta-lactamase family protein, partial [Gemmatimonadetes bacterium]|nr:beta-lactamase family protein [Gemmatimonadota bacterium]